MNNRYLTKLAFFGPFKSKESKLSELNTAQANRAHSMYADHFDKEVDKINSSFHQKNPGVKKVNSDKKTWDNYVSHVTNHMRNSSFKSEYSKIHGDYVNKVKALGGTPIDHGEAVINGMEDIHRSMM